MIRFVDRVSGRALLESEWAETEGVLWFFTDVMNWENMTHFRIYEEQEGIFYI